MKRTSKTTSEPRSSQGHQPPGQIKRKRAGAETTPVGYPPFGRGEHGPNGQGWFDEAELSASQREEKQIRGRKKKLKG